MNILIILMYIKMRFHRFFKALGKYGASLIYFMLVINQNFTKVDKISM